MSLGVLYQAYLCKVLSKQIKLNISPILIYNWSFIQSLDLHKEPSFRVVNAWNILPGEVMTADTEDRDLEALQIEGYINISGLVGIFGMEE